MDRDDRQDADANAPTPDAATAAAHLREAAAAGRTVAVQGSASASAWLTGLAAASAMYLFSLGWFERSDEGPILALSLAFAAVLGVLSIVHLRRLRAASLGFSRRFGMAVGGWGIAFAVSLALGLLLYPASPVFFALAAIATAVPPLHGSLRELVVVRG
ncbi:hypothetical protein BCL57_002112 [Agromyces flavus]|uniref:Uncharacterized protein n=1 Tax=Agromyces flavus TaxID=589382 RepID=A0A1H1PBQ3_9MICO|nr:hypothetical protein [Agromyces flavus]MCP2367953.1 hypothetical protein [Agromyces flavus]GGI47415.1 hypothetical protein GCM10010932_21030 [Agromyces flavus]SDS08706.1 hypothetical protein SAMN04489721_0749 [Agromyces flavus]